MDVDYFKEKISHLLHTTSINIMCGHRKISREYLFENIGKPSFTKNKELMTLTINFSLNCNRKAESKSSDEGMIDRGKIWLKETFGGKKNE